MSEPLTIAADPGSVAIVGLGLMGGSLLRALTARGVTAYGYNRSATTVQQASAAGYDATTDLTALLERAAADDALVVVATSLPAMDDVFGSIRRHAPGVAVTDLGSVKGPVAAAARARGLRFVGSHPMCGSAESGWQFTDPDLFERTMWVIATDDDADPQVWLRVAILPHTVGAAIVPAGSDDHDQAAAAISHLPHLMADATALVGAAAGPLALRLAAGSFRDGTRVAGSAPRVQQAMLEANVPALTARLDAALQALHAARDALAASGSVATIAAQGYQARRALEDSGAAVETIADPGVGQPGWQQRLRQAGLRGAVWLDPEQTPVTPESVTEPVAAAPPRVDDLPSA